MFSIVLMPIILPIVLDYPVRFLQACGLALMFAFLVALGSLFPFMMR